MSDTSLVFSLLAKDNTGSGLKSAESKFGKFQKAVLGASVAMGAGLAVAGKKAIDAASDYTEASNKTDAVFKKQAGIVRQFEQESTNAWGISKKAALDYTSAMGSVLTASGVNEKAAAKLSVEYTKLAADLGSFNNTTTEEAADALKASLTGEFEMLKKYGVVINDATLAQEAQRLGIEKAGATWSAAQKRQLSYNIVQRATKDAQGDVARNTDTAAFKQRQLQARMEDLQVTVGQKLLPVYISFLGKLQDAADWVGRNQSTVKLLLIVLGSLWGVMLGVTLAAKAWAAIQTVITAVTKGWAFAQKLLNMAMIMSPIGLLVLAIAGLIAIVVLIATKTNWFQRLWSVAWGAIKGAVSGVLNWVRGNWPKLLAILTGPIGIAVLVISKNWDKIKAGAVKMKDGIKSVFSGLGSILTAPIRMAVDGIRAAWNSTLGGKGFSAPSWLPGIGGKGFHIPYLAQGGTITAAGMAMVGEAGPELLTLPRGAQVTPLPRLAAQGGGSAPARVEISFDFSGVASDAMVAAIRKAVRVKGGNVQSVLGR